MRKKPNLIPRLERCQHITIKNPETNKGQWLSHFPGYKKLHIEIGCGKGKFTVETAAQHPDTLYIAIERVADAAVISMERVVALELQNVYFLIMDAMHLPSCFATGEVDRIYINFCDPWPKTRDAKRRLTSPVFLPIYEEILSPQGEIHFKTDNGPLFAYSLAQFTQKNYTLTQVTHNLHEHGVVGVMTDYETKFEAQGIPIHRCVVQMKRGNA